MDLLVAGDRLEDFVCPACSSDRLRDVADAVSCDACERTFPHRQGVVDYVLEDRLDATSAREHTSNAIDLDSEKAVKRRVRKGERNPMLMAQMRRSMRAAHRLMAGVGPERTLVSLGSGSGFELPLLLEHRTFALVYSSDLAWTSTALVPDVTRHLDGTLSLFAADFDHLPIRRRADHVGFVFLALHHADDPHLSLERLLARNFDSLVLVEPITNRLVDALAHLGLARRVEYSGIRPEWLDVGRLRQIARTHGYAMCIETWWEVPRNVLPRRVRAWGYVWRPLVAVVEVLSLATRPFRFGSMAAIRFERLTDGHPPPARRPRQSPRRSAPR